MESTPMFYQIIMINQIPINLNYCTQLWPERGTDGIFIKLDRRYDAAEEDLQQSL